MLCHLNGWRYSPVLFVEFRLLYPLLMMLFAISGPLLSVIAIIVDTLATKVCQSVL